GGLFPKMPRLQRRAFPKMWLPLGRLRWAQDQLQRRKIRLSPAASETRKPARLWLDKQETRAKWGLFGSVASKPKPETDTESPSKNKRKADP
ncbi:MAG TPA: hypothetical protein VF627_08010, partial [Abditibacterium sp.]